MRPALRLVPSNTTQAAYTTTPRDPAYSVINPLVPGSRADACRLCDYDPARARQLLAAAGGWTGDGYFWFLDQARVTLGGNIHTGTLRVLR